jgi:hypothetical protein
VRVQTTGELGELSDGIAVLSEELRLELAEDGIELRANRWDVQQLRVERNGQAATISFAGRAQFFRGLGLLVERLRGDDRDFTLHENVAFKAIGPMIDVSQGNALPRVEVVKALMRKCALMGLNLLMLYSEDSYEVEGVPYFGYMRGRYSRADLQEVDDYADVLGIELVPCIQTLGHLYDVVKWEPFQRVKDDAETLLVGSQETYQLIEQMILATADAVRSRRIHLGLDEAWNLGLGRYLRQNGYRPKIELFAEHLARVVEIAHRNGLEPMIWADMFFRATSAGNRYDDGGTLSEAARPAVPDGVNLVYWSYHSSDTEFYRRWLGHHTELGKGRMPIFAGGVSNWNGWSPNYGTSFAATKAALQACKDVGVQEVLATIWGHDGTECDLWACLLGLQLNAEICYGNDVSDERLARRFETCCGGQLEDFMRLKDIDEVPGVPKDNPGTFNPSAYLLWQNPLLGLFDANIEGFPGIDEHYGRLARDFDEASTRNRCYSDMFVFYRNLCAVLALKAKLGLKLTAAYRSGDAAQLAHLRDEVLADTLSALRDLHDHHRLRWHSQNQPFGWEVLDARYGALELALKNANWRIGQFLAGEVECLPELEEQRLPFDGREGHLLVQFVERMQSASRLYWAAS